MTRHPNLEHRQRNKVRIISGRWRGRWIEFLDSPGLRPTPNRVRETLFNWLQGYVPGARVLDLFAGSGALGFEAASRGASRCTLIERDARNIDMLQAQANKLVTDSIDIIQADALTWLKQPRHENTYDVVFVDPPFDLGLWQATLASLIQYQWLALGAQVYVEMPVGVANTLDILTLGIRRQLRAGDVEVWLLTQESL
ncbi:MAG: 16S rRNA (guanine(966)-N(2))-methyltransferase RsmD [Pseudomonadales bacterium]|nr:16S rRNA (guanine(966)-N(2))-methyltransferase RsmD [Pseudomonadales bacterium]